MEIIKDCLVGTGLIGLIILAATLLLTPLVLVVKLDNLLWLIPYAIVVFLFTAYSIGHDYRLCSQSLEVENEVE